MKNPFDELSKQLDNVATHADNLTDIQKVLTPAFIRTHTKFNNVSEWLSNGACDYTTITDDYVKQSTDFDGWKDMYEAAATEYLQSLFGNIG